MKFINFLKLKIQIKLLNIKQRYKKINNIKNKSSK